jgi:hypothetical protein
MVSFALSTALPSDVLSQSVWLGAVAGRVESRQLRDREPDTGTRTGLLAGAFVDVQTPAPLLSVLGEAAWVQRGARVRLPTFQPTFGDVEGDYLAMTVAPTLRLGIRGVSVFVYGGPTLEFPVRTRSSGELESLYANPSDQVFSVTAGAGVEVRRGSWSARGEARVTEGLSAAYTGAAGDFRHRSTEILLRLGRMRGR